MLNLFILKRDVGETQERFKSSDKLQRIIWNLILINFYTIVLKPDVKHRKQCISKKFNITIQNKVIKINAFNENCFFTNEIDELEIESHMDIKVDIILNKLVFFIKIMALSETILISLDTEEPCKFSIIIKDDISINYYIMNNNFLP